jgi:AAA family ATP:ADP antiporter
VQPTGLVPLQKPVFQQQPEKPVLAEPVKAAGGDAPAEGKKILGYDAFTWQKIIPLGAMFFCILFNYTILRDTKVRWAPTMVKTSVGP